MRLSGACPDQRLSLVVLGAAALVGGGLLSAGCIIDAPDGVGRPCRRDRPCAAGLFCVNRRCVTQKPSPRRDAGRRPDGDGARRDGVIVKKDGLVRLDSVKKTDTAPDTRVVKKDAGCAGSLKLCSGKCVNTTNNKAHCGGCNKACAASISDRCVASKCVCGTSGSACGSGLNCVSGSCRCISGSASRCTGCCLTATSCVALTSQSSTRCGKAGATCRSCNDSKVCTADTCVSGVCRNTNLKSGTACNDGKFCTLNTTCNAGTCSGGTARTCDPGVECQQGSCDETNNRCNVTPVPDSTPCTSGICQGGQCL